MGRVLPRAVFWQIPTFLKLKCTYAALLEDYRFPEQRLWQVPFVWP